VNGAKTARRPITGVLPLDKPRGITSHAAVQQARRLFQAEKAGHTGTLDPLATGLLPVCFGEATKFSHMLLEADKTYLATIRLGTTTTTGDLEGEETGRYAVKVERSQVETVLGRFQGEVLQVPPMYSAIKREGEPLYKLARAGKEVARDPRRIFISRLELLDLKEREATIRVRCSKGTYVRVLAEDIGRSLGCGGCLAALRREAVGGLDLGGAHTLERLSGMTMTERTGLLLPADTLVAALPRVDLDAADALKLRQGRPVLRAASGPCGLVRVYGATGEFLGVAEVTGAGLMVARRLMSQAGNGK
jgi:tRNA pseudouridine55 synthase